VVSDATPFQDIDAVAATKDVRREEQPQRGRRPEEAARVHDRRAPGVQEPLQRASRACRTVYGIDNAKFKQLALGLQYPSLDKGDVDTANVFSTDAQLASGKYQLLKDPKGIFGFQNVYFVINKDKYDALGGQQFMDVINKVNTLLTNRRCSR
jgi:osmoprotectant transport system substrate-binding protein